MNREDIKRIGHQVGLDSVYLADDSALSLLVYLERFAALVAAAERNRTWTQEHWTEYERGIAAAEREACAQVCEDFDVCDPRHIADAIRARGETK